MTLDERREAATKAIRDIEHTYGLRPVGIVQGEVYKPEIAIVRLGVSAATILLTGSDDPGAALVKAVVALELVPGWEAPKETIKQEEQESANDLHVQR